MKIIFYLFIFVICSFSVFAVIGVYGNVTVYNNISGSGPTYYVPNNQTIANAIDNITIVHSYNSSFVRNLLSGSTGIVYDSSTGMIASTCINGTGGTASPQLDMVIDFRSSKYNEAIWDFSDAEEETVAVYVEPITKIVFGRFVE